MSQVEERAEVDVERLDQDPDYHAELCRVLLSDCDRDADHVELRRLAMRMFPQIARPANAQALASIIGHAATIRAQSEQPEERDVTDARLDMTATDPLDFSASYSDLSEDLRATVIAFCERELDEGRDGPEALLNLLRLHGWPYSERTFYVGPWKAARLRQRRRGGGSGASD